MNTKLGLLLTMVTSLFLTSCIDSKKETSGSPRYPDDFVTINHVNDYSISIPNDMQQTTGLNSDALFQHQNVRKEMYTIVIDEATKTFVDALKEMGYDEKSTLGLYRDIQLKRLAERMDISHQSNPIKMTISGLEAETVQLDAKVDNIEEELSYFLTFIDGKIKIYMIMSWTLKSKKQEHKKTFEAIAQSFQVHY